MKIKFLGTGTSTGVPEIGCKCLVCTSSDKRDNRLRASVKIEVDDRNIFIDCSPDFRLQTMELPFEKIDGILITHEHYDHTGGIDDLRPFSQFSPIDLYAEPRVESILRERLAYCFNAQYGGVPQIILNSITHLHPFLVKGIEIIPIRVMHYKLPILGYRIGNIAYLTDVKMLPQEEILKLSNLDVLILSALRIEEHISHQNLSQAIALAHQIHAKRTYFTHMSYHIGLHSIVEKTLPTTVHFAYDGLEINI